MECIGDKHVFIWGSGSSTAEPSPDMACRCGRYALAEIAALFYEIEELRRRIDELENPKPSDPTERVPVGILSGL